MDEHLVPDQRKGSRHDTVSTVQCDSKKPAKILFEKAKARLLSVNHWSDYSEKMKASFALYDSNGKVAERNLQLNDYIRIDIPGPGNSSGEGDDWVQIIRIDDLQPNVFSFTARPSPAPLNKKDSVAHFYENSATSTFSIVKAGHTVHAEVHGRNEVSNIHKSPFADKIRNAVIAMGAIMGLGKVNWQFFTDALLET